MSKHQLPRAAFLLVALSGAGLAGACTLTSTDIPCAEDSDCGAGSLCSSKGFCLGPVPAPAPSAQAPPAGPPAIAVDLDDERRPAEPLPSREPEPELNGRIGDAGPGLPSDAAGPTAPPRDQGRAPDAGAGAPFDAGTAPAPSGLNDGR